MRHQAVLFDADGVLQKRPARWRDSLQEIVGPGGEPERFLADIFSVEGPPLCGRGDFVEALEGVLRRWECGVPVARLLEVWTMIEVDPDVTQVIRELRSAGIQCHLATNQEPYKARFMSQKLGYEDLFDGEFYSCTLGVAKPDAAYFFAILEQISLEPGSVLFLDDRRENVEAARRVGMHAAEFALASGASVLRQVLQRHALTPSRLVNPSA